MKFVKMHGIGNDFIIVNDLDENVDFKLEFFGDIISAVCDRHVGIGADGVIFMTPGVSGHISMRIFNSDGTEARMCGNGVRCLAAFYQEFKENEKSLSTDEVHVDTLSGMMNVRLNCCDGKKFGEVDMGKPGFEASSMPVTTEMPFLKKVSFREEGLIISCASMGNPHTVVFESDNPGFDMDDDEKFRITGRKVEMDRIFPDRTNVEFVRKLNDSRYKVRVWERGAGETLGCGTGACAVFAVMNKRFGTEFVTIEMPGGVLNVRIAQSGNILLKGEIKSVFHGTCPMLDEITG